MKDGLKYKFMTKSVGVTKRAAQQETICKSVPDTRGSRGFYWCANTEDPA